MELSTSKKFFLSYESFEGIIQWIRGYLLQISCESVLERKIEIVLEEALANILEHGYLKEQGEIEVYLRKISKKFLEITIIDEAFAFNPLKQAPQVDTSLPMEKRKEGGLGIYLMTQIVSEMHYSRKEGKNILTLKIRLEK